MDYMQNVDAFNDFNISKHADQSVYMYVLFPHIGRCNQCPWTIQFQCQVCYSDHIKKGYPDSKTNQTHLKNRYPGDPTETIETSEQADTTIQM